MRKTTLPLLALAAVLTLATLACSFTFNLSDSVKGSGSVEESVREIGDFSKIEFSGIGEIIVTTGEKEALSIEAEENLLPYLETYTRGETLVIKIKDGTNIVPTETIRFYITVVSLESVDVSGVGNVTLPELDTDHFSVSISGVGNVEIEELNAESFSADMSGLGDLTITGGEVVSQEISISGGGKYASPQMSSTEAEINVSGVGSATLRVSEYLDVTISGGGNVAYYGDPDIDTNISGVGNLDHLGD